MGQTIEAFNIIDSLFGYSVTVNGRAKMFEVLET